MSMINTLLFTCTLLLLGAFPAAASVTSGFSAIFTLDTVAAVEDDDGVMARFTRISSVYPNPFNPRTVIAFSLDISGPANLAIFDLRGQRVRSLVSGDCASGRHQIEWDGLDESGRSVPTGSYICRLTTARESVSRKLTIAR